MDLYRYFQAISYLIRKIPLTKALSSLKGSETYDLLNEKDAPKAS